MDDEPYHADRSLAGKLRRRRVRLQHRRPAARTPERPTISFSFDDAPLSAFTRGAGVLERHGVRGTFFVCAGTAGQDSVNGRLGAREDMLRAGAAGHELACHTYSHLDCGRADAAGAAADLDLNAETLQAWGLPAPETFAYPYGEVGAAAKRLAGTRFAFSRTVRRGLVDAGKDLAQAPGVGIEGEEGEALAGRWMDAARSRRAWLILFTHAVEERATRYGCSEAALERLVGRAISAGFDVVTVAEGARRLGVSG